jgi:hypothetical protein
MTGSPYHAMRAYTEIICPYTTHQAQCKIVLTPPSGSYSPLLSLGTGISAHSSRKIDYLSYALNKIQPFILNSYFVGFIT